VTKRARMGWIAVWGVVALLFAVTTLAALFAPL
jgi:hypothetical protein